MNSLCCELQLLHLPSLRSATVTYFLLLPHLLPPSLLLPRSLSSSIPPFLPTSFPPGLQLKLDGQDRPFASFTYVLSPLTVKLTPVDWKLLVTTEHMEYQHIRCHELQAGDKLPQLIASFKKINAVAVVLINTTNNYLLHPSFLSGTQECHFPVLVLTKTDGKALLSKVEQFEENVLARICVEGFVDLPMQQILQKTGKNSPHTIPEPGQWC